MTDHRSTTHTANHTTATALAEPAGTAATDVALVEERRLQLWLSRREFEDAVERLIDGLTLSLSAEVWPDALWAFSGAVARAAEAPGFDPLGLVPELVGAGRAVCALPASEWEIESGPGAFCTACLDATRALRTWVGLTG